MMRDSLRRENTYLSMRPAIALMVTVFFIMAITVAVGLSLSQLKKGNQQLAEGRFLVQSSAVMEDVLILLNRATEVMPVEDTMTLRIFLDSAALIPFEMEDLRVKIAMHSARGKFNLNLLAASEVLQEAMKRYLIDFNIQDVSYFVDILIDSMSGVSEVYRTELYDEMPWMYRDRVVDSEHFAQLLDFYVLMRHDNGIKSVPWEELISFGDPKRAQLDANYVTPALWSLMLPDASRDQIRMLVEDAYEVGYLSEADLGLSDDELALIAPFDVIYFIPVAEVSVMIEENNNTAEIIFQYDIASKQAKEFSYDI